MKASATMGLQSCVRHAVRRKTSARVGHHSLVIVQVGGQGAFLPTREKGKEPQMYKKGPLTLLLR